MHAAKDSSKHVRWHEYKRQTPGNQELSHREEYQTGTNSGQHVIEIAVARRRAALERICDVLNKSETGNKRYGNQGHAAECLKHDKQPKKR